MSKYYLGDDVKLFWENDTTFRVRKGIWNYSEANFNLAHEKDHVREFYRRCAEDFILRRECDVSANMAEFDFTAEEINLIHGNFMALEKAFFLSRQDQKELTKSIVNLLSLNFPGAESIHYVQPAFFIGDNGTATTIARFMSGEMNYPLDFADVSFVKDLSKADLTSRTEAMEHLKQIEKFEEILKPHSVVLGCFMRPNIQFLRNLNRVLIKMKKPSVLAFVDGPFLTLLATASPETGCFECFEHRVLARLEDTNAYNLFVKATTEQAGTISRENDGKSFSPMIGLLISAVLSEGFLTSSIRINKLSGRILNIYLPTLEIQVQDLLRVPYCPACGNIAAGEMNEHYTSARKVIDRMLEKIEIVES